MLTIYKLKLKLSQDLILTRSNYNWFGIACCLILAGCEPTSSTPAVVGQLAWDRVELTAEAAEPIQSIPVHEGQKVAAGDILVQLDDARVLSQLNQATAARKRSEAVLAESRRGTRSEQIAAAVASKEGAEAALAQANRDLRRQRELARQKLISVDALDKSVNAQAQAQSTRDAAAAHLAELRHGSTAEERTQTEQSLAQSIAAEKEAKIAVQKLRIIAPRPGRVDNLPFEVGERPAQGSVVVVLLVGNGPYARVYIPEPLRTSVNPGDEVQVHIDGQSTMFPGKVRKVSSDPLFTPYFALTEHDRHYLSYIAEITLENVTQLPAGAPVEVTLNTPLKNADIR